MIGWVQGLTPQGTCTRVQRHSTKLVSSDLAQSLERPLHSETHPGASTRAVHWAAAWLHHASGAIVWHFAVRTVATAHVTKAGALVGTTVSKGAAIVSIAAGRIVAKVVVFGHVHHVAAG